MGHVNFGTYMVFDDNKKGLFNVYFEPEKLLDKEKVYPTNMKWRHIPIYNNLEDM